MRSRRRTHGTQTTTNLRIPYPDPMPNGQDLRRGHRHGRIEIEASGAFAGPEVRNVNQRGAHVNHMTNEQQRQHESLAFDVVCGQLVDTTATEHRTSFQNVDYFFCCAKCKSAFDANPERYVRSDAYGPFH